MNQRPSIARRALALAASALLGLLAVTVSAGPSSAEATPGLSGHCAWDPAASQWVITWRLLTPAEAGSYRLAEVTATPADHPPDGISTTAEDAGFPHGPGEALVGEQRVPADTTLAALSVRTEWSEPTVDDSSGQQWSGQIDIPTECTQPEPPPDLISGFSFDCTSLTITIDNPLEEAVRLTLVPDGDDPLEVEVAGGESAKLQIPAGEGRSVDVRYDGHSVVDPAAPIVITSEEWAQLDCANPEPEDDLAVTGTPMTLVIISAIGLLGLGAGLYLVARHRRIRFTA